MNDKYRDVSTVCERTVNATTERIDAALTADPPISHLGRRRVLGAWYTPENLVRFVCDLVIDPLPTHRPIRVLDPACGDGRFLVEVLRRRPDADVLGLELDPGAAERARAHGIPVRTGDALTVTDLDNSFDAVVGNPPYLNQLAAVTSRKGQSPLGGGPYADTAAVFLAKALDWAAPRGGRVGLVLPQSVLATRDAKPIRDKVVANATIEAVWLATERVFDAAVYTCVLALERSPDRDQPPIRRYVGTRFEERSKAPAPGPGAATWGPLMADLLGIPAIAAPDASCTLGAIATASADFRTQFYELAPHVVEDGDGPAVVTCAHIEPNECQWGRVPTRIARRTLLRPTVRLETAPAWVRQRLTPKIVVATQTKIIEAAVDETGTWIPSVPVISVRADDLWAVAAVLLSPTASAWAAAHCLGAGLSMNAIKLRAQQVLAIPVPDRPWPVAAQRLREGDLDGAAQAMMTDYGEHPSVYEWWDERRRRAKPARSRPRSRPSIGR